MRRPPRKGQNFTVPLDFENSGGGELSIKFLREIVGSLPLVRQTFTLAQTPERELCRQKSRRLIGVPEIGNIALPPIAEIGTKARCNEQIARKRKLTFDGKRLVKIGCEKEGVRNSGRSALSISNLSNASLPRIPIATIRLPFFR
jgi:hypothetical protein